MADLEHARREAIRMLCLAQAEDRLSVEAFETRLDQIKHAPNEATLAAILADVEPTSSFPAPMISDPELPAVADRTAVGSPVAPADYLRVSSVFASTRRAGSWTVPLHLDGKVLFGELTLDLRDAVFASDVVDINVDVMLGSMSLIVPAGTQVENEIDETLSSSTHSTRGARGAAPNGLLVRLTGRAFLASIEVKEKFPSKAGKPEGFLGRLLGSGD